MVKHSVELNESDISRILQRLSHQLMEICPQLDQLVILGIIARGDHLARRIAEYIQGNEGKAVAWGSLDVTLYRDDTGAHLKTAGESHIPSDLTGKTVILVDDVLNSGRTIRSALDALNAYGRPAFVKLLVLLDRGERELPIQADFVGKSISVRSDERITVQLKEINDVDQVLIHPSGEPA